jgi:hypothetical protein
MADNPSGNFPTVGSNSWVNKSGGVFGFGTGDYGTYGYQMMMASSAISGVGDILASQNEANALNIKAGFSRFQAGENIKRAGMAQSEIQTQESTELQQSGSRANAIIGKQRAAYSAQGINVNTGSAELEQTTEGQMSSIDSQTIMNDAALKAWGIETGATQAAGQEQFEALGEEAQAKTSIILGGASALNQLLQQQETSERMSMMGNRSTY